MITAYLTSRKLWFAFLAFMVASSDLLQAQPTNGFAPTPNGGPWNNDVDIVKIDSAGNQTKLGSFQGAGVSTVTRISDGRLIAAFQYFPIDAPRQFDRIAFSFSNDEGVSWSRPTPIQIDDYPTDMVRPFDPTLVALPDGRIRMYFTSNQSPDFSTSAPQIYSAISEDRARYTFEPGVRFGLSGSIIIDCAVAIHKGVFHMIVPNNGTIEDMRMGLQNPLQATAEMGYHLISEDGLNFKRADDLRSASQDRWLGNMHSDGSRLFFFGTGPRPWPISSEDGVHWSRIGRSVQVPGADPGAVLLQDGSWLLLVTSPPRRNVHPPAMPWGNSSAPPLIRSTKIESSYRSAPEIPAGEFKTFQAADIALGAAGLNKSGGALLLNHPSGLATDGKSLLVCDRWNHRILIWKMAPRGNVPPDLVLGQLDFHQNNSGQELTQLNWPGNVSITPDGNRIAVADTNNDRILLWNSFPTQNGQAADIVIDFKQLPQVGIKEPPTIGYDRQTPRMRIQWPWGIWTDGQRLAAVATHGSAVLFWNQFPIQNHQPPDYMLFPTGVRTPRNITSDGKSFFALSDHNYGPASRPATLVWDHFPDGTQNAPTFVWGEWMKGTVTAQSSLLLAGMQRIYIWNSIPKSDQVDADVVLNVNSYRNGDGPDVALADGRLYVCNYNGNNVLGWNALTVRDNQLPDFSIGSNVPHDDTWSERFFIQNPALATDGTRLFASSDFDRKLYIWDTFPDESNAKPNWVYQLPEGPWDIAADHSRLAAAGRRTLYLWDQIPRNGEQPSHVHFNGIGSVRFQELTGVAIDSRFIYVADRAANRIYAWGKTPEQNSEPDFVLEIPNPGRLSSDGQYLVASPFEGHDIWIWSVDKLGTDNRPYRLEGRGLFNLPGHAIASEGRLFVADRNNHRVQIWNRIEEAFAGSPANSLLGAADFNDRTAGNTPQKLFMPGSLTLGGGYLWVGEFKFSTRILRFTPQLKPM